MTENSNDLAAMIAAAEQGDPNAQLSLGVSYQQGLDGEKDDAKAFYWFKKAAEQGNADALFNVGMCYFFGEGVKMDAQQALYWLEKAAAQGHEYAAKFAPQIRESINQFTAEKLSELERNAEHGDADMQYALGAVYEVGKNVEKDPAKAVYWYQKAAEQGHAEAQYETARAYLNGTGVSKDSAKAVYWFRKAAEQGDENAQTILGDCYMNGIGVGKDIMEAMRWYEKAAAQSNAVALKRLNEARTKQIAENSFAKSQKNADIKGAIYMALGAVIAAYIFTKGAPLYSWVMENSRELNTLFYLLLQLAAIVISAAGGAVAVGLLLGAITPSLIVPGGILGGIGGLITVFCYEDQSVYQIAKTASLVIMALAALVLVIQVIRRLARSGK